MTKYNEYGSRIITGQNGEPLDPPVVEIEVVATVRLKVLAATVDCYGEARTDLVGFLVTAMDSALRHDLPYADGRESTDLVQRVLEVEVTPFSS